MSLFFTTSIVFILGALIAVLGVASFWIQPIMRTIFGKMAIPISVITVIVGVLMMAGMSAFYALMQTTEGVVIFWGGVLLLVLGFILFYDPKKSRRKRK